MTKTIHALILLSSLIFSLVVGAQAEILDPCGEQYENWLEQQDRQLKAYVASPRVIKDTLLDDKMCQLNVLRNARSVSPHTDISTSRPVDYFFGSKKQRVFRARLPKRYIDTCGYGNVLRRVYAPATFEFVLLNALPNGNVDLKVVVDNSYQVFGFGPIWTGGNPWEVHLFEDINLTEGISFNTVSPMDREGNTLVELKCEE